MSLGIETLTNYTRIVKVKGEIFNRSDFHDFYTIKPFLVGDFGAKI